MLLTLTLSLGVYFLLPSGQLYLLPFVALLTPIFVMFVAPMALAAAGLRWAWSRLAPPPWRSATLPAVVLGSAAGPLVLLVVFTLDSPRMWLAVHTVRWDVILAPPMVASGAVAGYLAHRGTSPRSVRWWALTAASVAIGLALWAPLDPRFP